jgi:hypothetical protein
LVVGSVAHAAEPTLSQLLGRARVVVEGTVGSVDTFDEGRLALVHVQPTRVVKGAAGGELTVIERRDLSSVPDLMTSGATVLLFAVPATRTSSASAAIPAGRHFEPVGGRAGVVSGHPDDVDEATAIVQRLADASAKPAADATERAAARRTLVFDELRARLPRVVADGALSMGARPRLATPLTPDERGRIEAALARTDLPSWVRVDVVQAIAAAKLTTLAPALRTIPKPDGALIAAAWTALRALGVPPSADDLAQAFESDDPSVRAAAARELGKSGAPDAAAHLGKLALADPDEPVRVAATEALGNPRLPEAMPQLEKIFITGDWTLRQAAGRGINAIGGRPAQEAFGRLAFAEQNPSKKYAVTLLMLTGIDKNDPLMVKIAASHPDPDVRELLEHGLPKPHHHE